MIWIVNGADTPLVIRNATKLGYGEAGGVAPSEQKLQLVGAAYVDGIMYGEGYDASKLQELVLY
jgi:hypothetical protein